MNVYTMYLNGSDEPTDLIPYADHVAEVERALDDDVLAAAHHGQKGYEVGYTKAVEAMRAACIAAAESLDPTSPLYQATLLSILRTVNPTDPAHPAQQP